MSGESTAQAAARLNEILAESGLEALPLALANQFAKYARLLLRWNARINLTAIRDLDGILRRHFIESIVFARALPPGIATFLDFGSGAGFPGIPVALCRPEIDVTLAESQGKKAAFLREVLRLLDAAGKVYGGRAEALDCRFDCVGMRAVDKMATALATAAGLVAGNGWLALLTTTSAVDAMKQAAGRAYSWSEPRPIPAGSQRVLLLGQRA